MIYCPFDTPEKQQAECPFFYFGKASYCMFNCASDGALTDECRCAERELEIELVASEAFLAKEVKP